MARPAKYEWTAAEIETLKSLASMGCTRREAAGRMGRTFASVRNAAPARGVRFAKYTKGRPHQADWERAKQLAESGWWLSEGARKLGIHHTTALYISRQMGFRWPKRQDPVDELAGRVA